MVSDGGSKVLTAMYQHWVIIQTILCDVYIVQGISCQAVLFPSDGMPHPLGFFPKYLPTLLKYTVKRLLNPSAYLPGYIQSLKLETSYHQIIWVLFPTLLL